MDMAKTITLNAVSRGGRGTSEARRLRHAGRLPANLYSEGKAAALQLTTFELETLLRHHSADNLLLDLTVDGKPLTQPFLDPATMMADPVVYPCLGNEFGPVLVPESRLWVMGDNRTHSADSRAHCASTPAEAQKGILCTGDPDAGTVPVDNVIGKAQFIAWPPSRWGGVSSFDPQQG
jgi:ribosomal protein L25 (general stress protein Ctc)